MIGTKHVVVFETTGKGIFARVRGKVSFPRRDGQQPVAGEAWEVEVTGENAGKTVYFLRLISRYTQSRLIGDIPVKGAWYKKMRIWFINGMIVIAARKGSGRFSKGWEVAVFPPQTAIETRAVSTYTRATTASPLVVFEGDGGYVTGRGFSSKGGATDSYAVAYSWVKKDWGDGITVSLDFSPDEHPDRFLQEVAGMPTGLEEVAAWITAQREAYVQKVQAGKDAITRSIQDREDRLEAARQLGRSLPVTEELIEAATTLGLASFTYGGNKYTVPLVGWMLSQSTLYIAVVLVNQFGQTHTVCVGGPFQSEEDVAHWVANPKLPEKAWSFEGDAISRVKEIHNM